MTYKPCHPSSQQKCDTSSLNCSDHKLTQLLINHPVAVPSTCCILQEFMEDSYMSDVLLVLLKIDLSGHRSIGLFIFTMDSQYNVPGEIIQTWDLRNNFNFQQTASVRRVFFFLGSPKSNAHALRFVAVSVFPSFGLIFGSQAWSP